LSFTQHKEWVDLFMGWSKYGFELWRGRAGPDATLTFLCELGPREYAMTGADGYELSDRFEEALWLKQSVRKMWEELDAAQPVLAEALHDP
jgi:hypothetical protein